MEKIKKTRGKQMKFLVTGTAGFIGFSLSERLLSEGHTVVGIDNLNPYYDPAIKKKRNNLLSQSGNYKFYKQDLSDFIKLNKIISLEKPEMIIHLAAQAGVRYSLSNPMAYELSNNMGTMNILESAKLNKIRRVIFASSSSVYGNNEKTPFSESDRTDTPISLYAATKKANEVLAYTYHHLYGMEIIGLRFFTVYGPYGRPDMAIFKFCKNILSGKKISVYNNGKMSRNFTFISDITDGIIACINKKDVKYSIYNLGGNKAVPLMIFIKLMEQNLGIKAKIKFLPIQAGDVQNTIADISKAKKELGYNPKVGIEEGMKIFCDWFLKNKTWLLKLENAKQ